MKEIGSEYHWESPSNREGVKLPLNLKDKVYTFTGRTSYEVILKNEPNIKRVLFPSYCCESMLDPFIKKGIAVEYYHVYFEKELKYNIDIHLDVDAIIWCNYFGFNTKMPDFSSFTKRGGIIIEDITHSFFSELQYDSQSHYLVASLRKWGPLISGGFCASTRKMLSFKPYKEPAEKYILNKKQAMVKKSKYLLENDVNKNDFMDLFSYSNEWLSNNYSNLMIDKESFEYIKSFASSEISSIRRKNAELLYRELKGHPDIIFMFEEKQMDCPLFVPIIIEPSKRNKIRTLLIKNNVFCPVHWTKPNDRCTSNIYNRELSLICDQRYDEKDMRRIISILCK